MSGLKKCFKCGGLFPRSEFYKHKAMADGLLGKCKACTKADVSEHRLLNVERIRAYDRERSKSPERIAAANLIANAWRKRDARISMCHNAVARAVRNGTLVRKSCESCGSEKTHAHHDSYSRPLDVMWLCAVCHKARHKELAAAGLDPLFEDHKDE